MHEPTFNSVSMQLGGIVCLALATSQGDLKKVYALLPDARESGHGSGHHPQHVAALQFYTDQLSPDNKLTPDLRFRLPGSCREQGIVFLVREDLEFEGINDLTPPSILHSRSDDHRPHNDAEERDFFWAADLAALGMKGLQSGCVDAMAVPPDSLLARFALYGGVLSTGEVARAGSIPFEVPFLDRDDLNNELKTYHQAVALWANWEARIPPNNHYEVGIRFTSFDTRKVRTLLLSYAGLPSGGSLWLSLKNVTLSDLLELSDAIEPNVVRESHFDLHYTIADMIPNPQWVPDLSRATDGKPLCPPAQLQVEV